MGILDLLQYKRGKDTSNINNIRQRYVYSLVYV